MGVNRREFIKTSLAAGALSSLDLKFMRFAGSAVASVGQKGEAVTRTTCSPNCTGACGFNVHVKDGRIATLIQAADYPEDSYNPRGCLRGLSMMNLVYGKDRVKYPLIRTGPRGSGEFRRASWDEALFYADLDDKAASLEIIDLLLKTGGMETKGITLDMVKKGPVRLHSTAPGDRQVPFYEQVHDRVPFPPPSYPAPLPATARFVKSGRIEFYKDEDLFLAEGEHLPVNKPTFEDTEYREDPDARTRYRLRYVTKNSLYRVHSTHSNNVWLNELQGHKPKVFLNPADAAERGIAAEDLVEVYNNRGKTRAYAVIDPGCRRGTLIFEQGWWAKYLQDHSYNSLTRAWIKPLHEIYFVPGIWSPTTVWNECLVDARRIIS
jgi:anaerobic selenocysteine-containing dehydrogenase